MRKNNKMRERGTCDDKNITFEEHTIHSVLYGSNLSLLYRFFRSHSDGRYSARTMNKLSSLPIDWEETRNGRGSVADFPTILMAGKQFTFDDETETKTGGKVGVAVVWPNGTTVIAVHREGRRTHIGSALIERVQSYNHPVMWVGRQNIAGQMFSLKSGLFVTAMNANGALRMANTAMDEDGMEGTDEEVRQNLLRAQSGNVVPRRPERARRDSPDGSFR